MIIHTETQSLLLQAADPLQIRDLLPRSKLLRHADYNIAIKHTLEATKVLRNIGHAVPSPIRTQYRWPGKFKPFSHQLDMAEFLTLHKRAFNLSEMGCVSADTEYLSPAGWVQIDNYTSGPVAQYHPGSNTIEFVLPTEYVKLPCPTMVKIKTKYGIDQLLSPEHRVVIKGYANPERIEVLPATTLLDRHARWIETGRTDRTHGAIPWSQSTIPTAFVAPGGVGLPYTDDQLRLLVAVIADGHFPARTLRCCVRLKKSRKKTRLVALLVAAGVAYTQTEPEYPSAPGFSVFRFDAPRNIKHFDSTFWGATAHQLRVIASESIHWDGSVSSSGTRSFSTGVKESADFVQYAFTATGTTARLTETLHTDGAHPRTEYVVTVRNGTAALMLKSVGSDGARNSVMSLEPSPDGFKYCFMVPSTFLVFRRNGCIFCSGNSAKTNAALWAADWLMSKGFVKKVLILSPLSTLDSVWRSAIFDTLMHRRAVIVHGDKDKRQAAMETDSDFYILNHEGVTIKWLAEHIRQRPDINLVIVDEAGLFRNHDTNKYKSLAKMLRPDIRLWLMTGTPCPNNPTDAWALAKLVNPARVPQYFGAFKRQTMTQMSQFKWVARADSYTVAYDAMQPAVRFKKADCLDLPPVTTIDHQSGLSTDQEKSFAAMKLAMKTAAKTTVITAVNAADQINKLRQLLCGAIKDPVSGDYITIPHAPRTQVLLDAIEQASAKVIVVVPFKGIIQSLVEEVSKHHSVAILNGDVAPKARDKIIRAFKETPDPRVLLCHPKVMAHGLNLTEADMLIFYAPIYSNDEFQQVTERFNRAGQTRKMTIIRIGAHPMEWAIYSMVDGKKVTQDNILSLYAAITE